MVRITKHHGNSVYGALLHDLDGRGFYVVQSSLAAVVRASINIPTDACRVCVEDPERPTRQDDGDSHVYSALHINRQQTVSFVMRLQTFSQDGRLSRYGQLNEINKRKFYVTNSSRTDPPACKIFLKYPEEPIEDYCALHLDKRRAGLLEERLQAFLKETALTP